MKIKEFPKKLAIILINIYQSTLSPDYGLFRARHQYGFCRFYPTCSQYAKEAIEKNGLFKGILLGLKRIIKCSPWAEPKVDRV